MSVGILFSVFCYSECEYEPISTAHDLDTDHPDLIPYHSAPPAPPILPDTAFNFALFLCCKKCLLRSVEDSNSLLETIRNVSYSYMCRKSIHFITIYYMIHLFHMLHMCYIYVNYVTCVTYATCILHM